jgi:hypothetical protein
MTSLTIFFILIPILSLILLAINLLFSSHNPYKKNNMIPVILFNDKVKKCVILVVRVTIGVIIGYFIRNWFDLGTSNLIEFLEIVIPTGVIPGVLYMVESGNTLYSIGADNISDNHSGSGTNTGNSGNGGNHNTDINSTTCNRANDNTTNTAQQSNYSTIGSGHVTAAEERSRVEDELIRQYFIQHNQQSISNLMYNTQRSTFLDIDYNQLQEQIRQTNIEIQRLTQLNEDLNRESRED